MQLIGPKHPTVQLNIYPGLLSVAGVRFGLYASGGYYDGAALGLSASWLPLGPGVAESARRRGERGRLEAWKAVLPGIVAGAAPES